MNYNLNRGKYKSLENTWVSILEADSTAKINANISAIYSGDSMRPIAFVVSYSVNGGVPISAPFMNEYEGRF